jgi:Cu+-exporting ATPase
MSCKHSHKSHEHETEVNDKTTDDKTKDPVCGMVIDKEKAASKSEYKGKTHYFCSLDCKKAFDENPEKYLKEYSGASRHDCC